MITTHISGGLGNQLFQYATGRALAFNKKVKLKIDRRIYISRENKRTFELNNFNIDAKITPSAYLDHLEYKFITTKTNKIFPEKSLRFDKNIFKQPNGTYLLGHWQSEKYFKTIASKIKKELTYKPSLNSEYKYYLEEIKNSNSAFCHIRRGDYVSNSTFNKVHGLCSIDYYEKALKYVSKKVNNPHIFVFSDDIKWAKTNFKPKLSSTYIHPKQENACQELELMKYCKHAIIANSSFSWWGAWLMEYDGKIIIAPKKWFSLPTHDSTDIVPDRWVRM